MRGWPLNMRSAHSEALHGPTLGLRVLWVDTWSHLESHVLGHNRRARLPLTPGRELGLHPSTPHALRARSGCGQPEEHWHAAQPAQEPRTFSMVSCLKTG